MTTLYKLRGKQLLVVTGHLTKAEIHALKTEGYRFDNPSINKNGIRIAD